MWFVVINLGEGEGVGAKLNRLRLETNYELMMMIPNSETSHIFLTTALSLSVENGYGTELEVPRQVRSQH